MNKRSNTDWFRLGVRKWPVLAIGGGILSLVIYNALSALFGDSESFEGAIGRATAALTGLVTMSIFLLQVSWQQALRYFALAWVGAATVWVAVLLLRPVWA
jgi:hypothetical protein